ncbi:UNVERIFIED_CONTAM: hypothetical protein PYX00_004152 [Menopon gallinae]|uniref:Uncharacterized protein n=1 Tax=Menopon gallinae TaxID=328185 RepID=A0AAW2I355_9NEOP
MNTREKSKSRKPSMDVEDLSEEFYGDALSRLTKKRHRRSHHRDGEEADDAETNEESPKDAKTLRKEMKLRKILDRMNKRRKSDENDSDQGKSRLRARLEAKLAKLSAMEPSTEMTETPEEVKSTDNIVEMTTETPEEAIVGEEKEEKVEQSTTTEINVKADDKKPEENNEEVAAQPENVTESDPKVEQQKPDAEEKKPDIAVSSDLKKAPEVATEAPAAVETTLAATTEKSPEKKKEKVPADESLEMPQTILLIPEVEGLMYNPVIVAHAMENGEGLREEDYDGDMPTQVTNLEPFLREETSVPESVELARYSQPELPDLITELLEGQTMPWKGARAEEMEPSNGKRGSKSNEGNRAEKIVRMQEPEEREDKSELVGSYPGGSGAFVGSKSNEGSRAQKIVRMQEPEDKIELVGSYPGGSGSFVGSFASVSDVHTSRIPEGKRGEEIRDSGMDSDPNSSVAGLMKAELEDELSERESLETEMPATLSRKRRGIFDRGMLTPEERIRNFKRIVHRRHSPFGHRNELPVPENGESFWKMAGSTVKAVFNDVIPEAYGKTKNKIENLGIAEYFKEFGKIVEQMKNLDKLFANIGQAAVRNYIKGTEDEKGDYIQVIEKRRRSRRDVEGVLTTEMEQPTETTTAIPEQTTASNNVQTTVDLAENKPKPKGLKKSPKERPNDLIRDIFLLDSNPGIVEVTKTPLTTEAPQTISLQPFESRYAKMPKMNHIQSRFYKRESLKNQPLSEAEIQSMGISKFAPWMKTTKDFISQALTTLQRQRELSEMIARESVNDLVKREIERKVIGKREASVGGARFPVYQMPNRKREVYGNADDANSKFLNQLQPGVYIVPTEEMKNLRSEQITKEAPATKPGMPNMVTLNIYYDKKKPEEWSSSREADTTNVNEYVSYYNAPDAVWSPVPIANPTGEFVPPLPETTIGNGYLPPVPQHMPPFHTETRFHDPVHQRVLHYPEPYPDWVPAHGYPPRTQTFYYPEHQPYGPPKSDWADFKMHHVPTNREAESDSGWAVQFHPTKKPAKAQTRPTLRPPRTFPDKKRSIGKGKMDSNFPGLALPFWKFFTPKKDEKLQPTTAKPIDDVSSESESESIEELFAENRKRAKLNEAKNKDKKPEVTEAPAEEPQPEGSSRKRRDVVTVEFQDHDLIPEWFGTIQELDNTLHDQHDELERLARIVPLSLYDYEDDHSFLGEDILHRRRRDADDGKPVVKSLKSEDSSLEVQEHKPEEKPGKTEQPKSDDVISQFFKYAYESLVEMMKGMTGFI